MSDVTVSIRIPGPLRGSCDNQSQVEVTLGEDRQTVWWALVVFAHRFPGLLEPGKLFLDEKPNPKLNIFLDDENVRYIPGEFGAPLTNGQTISLLPQFSGG